MQDDETDRLRCLLNVLFMHFFFVRVRSPDVFAFILFFSARRSFAKACIFLMKSSTASTDVL